jgi:hypothetical protein
MTQVQPNQKLQEEHWSVPPNAAGVQYIKTAHCATNKNKQDIHHHNNKVLNTFFDFLNRHKQKTITITLFENKTLNTAKTLTTKRKKI